MLVIIPASDSHSLPRAMSLVTTKEVYMVTISLTIIKSSQFCIDRGQMDSILLPPLHQ